MTYNHIRCPHCQKVISHPALAEVGQRDITIQCPNCGKIINLKK